MQFTCPCEPGLEVQLVLPLVLKQITNYNVAVFKEIVYLSKICISQPGTGNA